MVQLKFKWNLAHFVDDVFLDVWQLWEEKTLQNDQGISYGSEKTSRKKKNEALNNEFGRNGQKKDGNEGWREMRLDVS